MGMLIPRMLLNGTRFTGGGRTNGKWVNGSTIPLEIRASVQKLSEKDLQNLPEGVRASGQAYRLYTDDVLRTVQDDERADQVTIYGEVYEVSSVAIWANNVISHNKYIATRLTSK